MHFCTCCSVVIDPAAPMAASRRTRFCTYCSQELSHAAYYRHLEDKSGSVCPGKRLLGAESDDSSASEAMPSDGESGQALQSSNDMAENSPMVTESFDETNMEMSDQEDSSDSDDSINGTEIWESSEDEEESQSSEQAQRILYGMALFLTKFQLFFKMEWQHFFIYFPSQYNKTPTTHGNLSRSSSINVEDQKHYWHEAH